jgi:sterol desaturase/sphingolipid hydroxylase (fatty acid hydroxylase superfamily)
MIVSIYQTAPGIGWLKGFLASIELAGLAASTAKALLVLSGFFVLFWALEARSGADRRRYWSRNFLNDVVYAMFYQGGFYNVLVFAAVLNLLSPRLEMFELGLVEALPPPVDYVLYWVVVDFLAYWIHRIQHTIPFLWSFHSVHHSQESMTFLTTYRNHPFEMLMTGVVMIIPVLMLGIPSETWILLYTVQMAFEAAQHSEVDWTYGRLYPVFVSPRFHSFHHAVDARYHHRNFGKILSIWDHVFGTAVSGRRPGRFGVTGLEMKETLTSQLLVPFRLAWRAVRGADSGSRPPALGEPAIDSRADNE